MNRLYYGDNLEVLRNFGDECVDLIYLDPPFNSNAGYNVLFKSASGAGADASIEAFDDTWTWDGAAWQPTLDPVRPIETGGHSAFPTPTGSGITIFGGTHDDGPSSVTADIWRFAFGDGEAREQCDVTTDNDGDGLQGCADPDCWWRCAPECPPGAPCDMTLPHCGDNTCNSAVENCRICAQDCPCTAACGDTFCEGTETQAGCPADCTP